MLFLVNMVRESLRRARLLAARTPALRRWVDSADDGGYAAYERLMVVLSFAEIPASFPGALLGADVVARQATYLRRWLRANPQKGELLQRPRLAATALEQLASLRFDRAEANVPKPRSASTRKG